MSETTGIDAEHKREKISNFLLSMKYGIKAMKDWKQGRGQDDEETKIQLEVFDEVQQELNKPYRHKTAGLPSPKANKNIDTQKALFGDSGEEIEQKLETLSEFAERLSNGEEDVDENEIDEMIEQAIELGTMMQNKKSA